MMCPDCGCDLTNSYISCPNCGRELVKIHYRPSPQPVQNVDELKRQNDLLEEQNRLLKSIDASQKTTAAYTMLNVFWH